MPPERLLPGILTASASVIRGRFSGDRKRPLLRNRQGALRTAPESTGWIKSQPLEVFVDGRRPRTSRSSTAGSRVSPAPVDRPERPDDPGFLAELGPVLSGDGGPGDPLEP